jgi:hypothetical protein
MPVNHVFFEDVMFSSSTAQTQLWSSLRGAIMLAACKPWCAVHAIPVGTLKKFATGKGNATKEEMLSAFVYCNPFSDVLFEKPAGYAMDDNEVDALHLLNLARKELSC